MKNCPPIPELQLDRFPPIKKEQVYAVGGCIRDLLLGRQPQDYDLAVAVDPKKFAGRVAEKNRGRMVILGRESHRTYRVITGSTVIDIASLADGTIQKDLRRRDFTVNAMACDLATGRLIDCRGGQDDLRRGVVRMISVEAFRSDPLRMLRAYRLAAQFSWRLEPATAAAVASDKRRIQDVAGERIWDELQKLLTHRPSHPALAQMAATGLLIEILPELQAARGHTDGDPEPLRLLLAAYDHLERLLANPTRMISNCRHSRERLLAAIPTALLKLSLLLHAVGSHAESPAMRIEDPASQAAAAAVGVCRRLRASVRQSAYVQFVLRNHMRPVQLYREKAGRRGRVRFFQECHPRVVDILLHAAAVRFAAGEGKDRSFVDFVRGMLAEYCGVMLPLLEAPPLLTGKDLIERFHLKPSPRFRSILAGLKEARLVGEVRNRSEALHWVQAALGRQKPSG